MTKRGVSLLLQSRVIRRSKCWMTTEEVGLLLFLVNGCSMTSEAPRRCFATYRRIAVVQGHQSHYCKSKNQNNDWRHLSVEVLHTLLPTLSEYHKQFLICNFLTLDWRSSNFYGVNVWVLATFGSNILRNWRGRGSYRRFFNAVLGELHKYPALLLTSTTSWAPLRSFRSFTFDVSVLDFQSRWEVWLYFCSSFWPFHQWNQACFGPRLGHLDPKLIWRPFVISWKRELTVVLSRRK